MLRTEDIFLAAFGLVRGGAVDAVEVRGVVGRRMAFFRIVGPDMDQVESEYYQGQSLSLVNLRLLKSEVARLKSIAFEALRKEESRHAGHEVRSGSDQGFEPAPRGRR